MQNQTTINSSIPENLGHIIVENFKSEISTLPLIQVKLISEKLNNLFTNIDPFNLEALSIEQRELLAKFNLEKVIENPYLFTNMALRILDILDSYRK